MTGKIVLSQTLNVANNNQIDVSNLAKGFYIAELRAENKQVKRVKVVKE